MSQTTSPNDTITKVQNIANMAGYHVHPHEQIADMLTCGFDMGGGRSQVVYISPIATLPNGNDVIAFMSPCQAVKKGMLSGISKKQALDLLARNANLIGGSFAMQNFGDTDVLMVRSTQVVQTMEIEEFSFHVGLVATVADAYEQEHGSDVF